MTLNYGAAAQPYFGATGALANADIPASQKAPTVKVTERELSDLTGTRTEGAAFSFTAATLLLGDTVQIRLYLDATDAAAATGATLYVTMDGKTFKTGALTCVEAGEKKYTATVDIPMRYYDTDMTFSVKSSVGALISDTVRYSVGCYAKRMYAKGNDNVKNVLDAVLALGDASATYYEKVSNAVSTTVAVPAAPGETIDLGRYSVSLGDQIVSGMDVTWGVADTALANAMTYDRYVLAPSTPGVYKMLVSYQGNAYIICLAVATEGTAYTCPVAEKIAASVIDLSAYGDKAAAAKADVPAYWTWTLQMAAYLADCNAAGVTDKSKLDTFLFLTDTHWEQNNKNSFKLANWLAAELEIDCLHFGGDILNGNADLTEAKKAYASWLEAAQTFSGQWYAVRGNHDQNASWRPNSLDDVITDKEL